MIKEFKQLRKLAGYTSVPNDYLDPDAGIEVIDSITILIGKVMVTRVKDFFDHAYQPKFDFKVTTGKLVYTYGDYDVVVTFKSQNERRIFRIGMNTTKRKYTCNDFSQSTTIRTMLGKIEKEVYAATKAAKKVAKPVKKVDVDELIRFHS